MREKPKLPEDCPEDVVWIGGPIDRYSISLRIIGDSLVPEEITKLLGVEPTDSHRVGDEIRTPSGKALRIAKTGRWSVVYQPIDEPDWNFEVGLLDFLSTMTSDLTVWDRLSKDFEVDLFCGLFLDAWNRGLTLSPTVLKQISDRNLTLGLDIYGPSRVIERPA